MDMLAIFKKIRMLFRRKIFDPMTVVRKSHHLDQFSTSLNVFVHFIRVRVSTESFSNVGRNGQTCPSHLGNDSVQLFLGKGVRETMNLDRKIHRFSPCLQLREVFQHDPKSSVPSPKSYLLIGFRMNAGTSSSSSLKESPLDFSR